MRKYHYISSSIAHMSKRSGNPTPLDYKHRLVLTLLLFSGQNDTGGLSFKHRKVKSIPYRGDDEASTAFIHLQLLQTDAELCEEI